MVKEFMMIRFCVVCGKKLNVILRERDDEHQILEGGGYWPKLGTKQGIKFEPKSAEHCTEYWECVDCMKGDDFADD